jgi:hypothetical protein
MGDTASNGSGNYASATWIAITADTATPVSSNTTLTGELTGGTMGRSQAAYAHTNGQATYTLTKQFTADRTVTVAKCGVFTASTGGTMAFEALLDSTAGVKSGDTLQIVQTISL